MKRPVRATAAALVTLGAAVAVLAAVSLPPPQIALSRSFDDGTVAGAIHVHTDRSDGRLPPDAVAATASRAGLRFVVFTDHGDATRTPEPPTYRYGVLCIDAVEISSAGGHYLALDMPAAPYRLGGEARDVVEDVKRLGGFGVAAHPDSPKDALRWQEWDAPFDAVEIVNPDTSWRRHLYEGGVRPKLRLLSALFTYPFRGRETIANLLHESAEVLARWEPLARQRRIPVLAGLDAHATLALRAVDPVDAGLALPLPRYEATFRALSIRVATDRPLDGNAGADAVTLMRSIREGRLYAAADGLASPPAFEFTAANESGTARAGEELRDAGPVTLTVRSNAPPSFTATVWRGGELLATDRHEPEFSLEAPAGPAVYRVDIRAADRPHQPVWVVSNPIYVRGSSPPEAAAVPGQEIVRSLVDGPLHTSERWGTEHDAQSTATFETRSAGFAVRYSLAPGPRGAQFASLRLLTTDGLLAGADGVAFRARANRPMRLSIQVRTADRWQRSIYVDGTERLYVLRFDDFRPVGTTSRPHPAVADLHSLMWVVDTTNTAPGSAGEFSIDQVRTVRIM